MPSQSFTVASNGGLLNVLQTQCHIAPAYDPRAAGPHPDFKPFQAVWDTGASASVITQRVVDQCGLKPIGMVEVHGVHSKEICPVYLVNVGLPNHVGVESVRVTLGRMVNADVLIGMDIIGIGDFAVTNKNGVTVFTFRVPSSVCIDFVKEHALRAQSATRHQGGGFQGHPHRRAKKHK